MSTELRLKGTGNMQVRKRDGKVANFDRTKIENAVLKACRTVGRKSCDNILSIETKL